MRRTQIHDVPEVEALRLQAALQCPPMHAELRRDPVDAAAIDRELALDQRFHLLADVERKAPDQVVDVALGRRLQLRTARIDRHRQ